DPARPGTFLAPTDIFAGPWPICPVLARLSVGGRLDLAVTSATTGDVCVFLHDPDRAGRLLAAPRYQVGPDGRSVAYADLDGDGLLDLVASVHGAPKVSVLRQDPAHPGTFLPAVDYAVGHDPYVAAIGDVNG